MNDKRDLWNDDGFPKFTDKDIEELTSNLDQMAGALHESNFMKKTRRQALIAAGIGVTGSIAAVVGLLFLIKYLFF